MSEPGDADEALVDLLTRRTAARSAKDFATADRLRDEIAAKFAVDLNDRANTWRDSSGRVGTQVTRVGGRGKGGREGVLPGSTRC